MRKFCLGFLLTACCAMAVYGSSRVWNSGLRVVEGTLLGIKNNVLSIETAPQIRFRIPLTGKIKLTSPSGPFSFLWLLPGDGIRVFLEKNGRAGKIEVFSSWTFGTVAFASENRLTLLEGPQFFADGAPVFLNGRKISSLSGLKPPEEVLVRFDSLGKKTAGIWAFDPSEGFKESGSPLHGGAVRISPLQNTSWVSVFPRANKLQISVKTRPAGRLRVRLMGATQEIPLRENQPGHYQTTLVVPRAVNLPRSYLAFHWLGSIHGEKVNQTWIFPKPISFYTETPRATSIGPTDGSTAPVNPPFIFANFDPAKAPLALNSVRLVFDHKNVTADCYVNPYLVFFAPPTLSPGKHDCFLSGRTLNGNGSFRIRWSFYVSGRRKGS